MLSDTVREVQPDTAILSAIKIVKRKALFIQLSLYGCVLSRKTNALRIVEQPKTVVFVTFNLSAKTQLLICYKIPVPNTSGFDGFLSAFR